MLAIKKTGTDEEYPVLLVTPDMQERLDQFYERDRLPELHDYYDPVVDALDQFGVPARLPVADPKIGQLFWPVVGAARYAHAVILLDSHTLGKLMSGGDAQLEEDASNQTEENGALQSEEVPGNAVTLLYRDSVLEDTDPVTPGVQAETARTFPMYLLAARPLVETGAKADTDFPAPSVDDAWVCVLVDARYYWLEDTGAGEHDELVAGTWQDLINALKGELSGDTGPILTLPSLPEYLAPTERWLYERLTGLSTPHLLDAAAAYIGGRMIYTPDGGLAFQLPTLANKNVLLDAHTAAIDDERHVGGGELDQNDLIPGIPASALCFFYSAIANGNTTVFDASTGGGAVGRHTIAWLDMTTDATGAQQEAAANKWASSYFEWQLAPLDALYAGALAVPESAHLCDAILFHDATLLTTRWTRTPVGWGAIYRGSTISGADTVPPTPCKTCGWLTDRSALVASEKYLTYEVFEGATDGRCDCIVEQFRAETAPPNDGIAQAKYDIGEGKWIGLRLIKTCCGCATVRFDIPDPETGEMTGTLSINNRCDGGGTTTYDLIFQCCTEDTVVFAAGGPKNCSGTGGSGGIDFPCDNSFIILVRCSDCLMENVECDSVRETCAPPILQVIGTGFTGTAVTYNNTWSLWYVGDCVWEVQCGDILVRAEKVRNGSDQDVLRVTLSGGAGGTIVFERVDVDTYHLSAFATQTASWVSGNNPESPDTLDIVPVFCETCPEKCGTVNYASITATVIDSSGSCGTLTVTPGANGETNPLPEEWFVDFAFEVPLFGTEARLSCTTGGGLSLNFDTGPSYVVNRTLISVSYEPFVAVYDVTIESVLEPPGLCLSTYRVVFME